MKKRKMSRANLWLEYEEDKETLEQIEEFLAFGTNDKDEINEILDDEYKNFYDYDDWAREK